MDLIRDNTLRMKAVVITRRWFHHTLELQEVPHPFVVDDDQVLITVTAVGVNREDIICRRWINRQSDYACPGFECSGIIAALGRNVTAWHVGDEVCAILDGGGYAERVVVPAANVLSKPSNISLGNAASLPLACCTIWLALFERRNQGSLTELTEPKILIHEGASEIGLLSIQIAKYMGMKVFTVAENQEQLSYCKARGADICINYNVDFSNVVLEETQSRGVDFVLDFGARYFREDLNCLAFRGKLVLVDLQGNNEVQISVELLIQNLIQVQVIDLRTITAERKAAAVTGVQKDLWPAIEQDKVNPLIHSCMPLAEAQRALCILKKKQNIGKILLYP